MPGGRLYPLKTRSSAEDQLHPLKKETRSPGGRGGSSVASLLMSQPLYAGLLPGSLGAHGGDGHVLRAQTWNSLEPNQSSCCQRLQGMRGRPGLILGTVQGKQALILI